MKTFDKKKNAALASIRDFFVNILKHLTDSQAYMSQIYHVKSYKYIKLTQNNATFVPTTCPIS